MSAELHEWSKEALLGKAQRYADIMASHDRDNWQFGFWSALTLEMIARAALSNISQTLLADPKDWNNVLYSLGRNPIAKKYTPKSIGVSDIITRLESLLPEFTNEMLSFCLIHGNRRNSEVHTGNLAFEDLGTSKWLGKYYHAITPLLESMEHDLEYLFGEEEAELAEELIKASTDEAAKSVAGTIKAHKTVWSGKEPKEQSVLAAQGETLSSKKSGHRVKCPACNSTALLHGSPTGEPKQSLDGDLVVIKQALLPSSFECYACDLKISGFSKLHSCGLGDSFTDTTVYEPTKFFQVEPEDDYQYEPDYND